MQPTPLRSAARIVGRQLIIAILAHSPSTSGDEPGPVIAEIRNALRNSLDVPFVIPCAELVRGASRLASHRSTVVRRAVVGSTQFGNAAVRARGAVTTAGMRFYRR